MRYLLGIFLIMTTCQDSVQQALPLAQAGFRPVSTAELGQLVSAPVFEKPEANVLMQRFMASYNQVKDEVQALIAQENSLAQLLSPREKQEFRRFMRELDLPESQ